VIPWLLASLQRPAMYWPSDVCVSAPTGSGKTLAFALPIIQALYSRLTPQIRALVVLPVQDLAKQVAKVFNTYCRMTNLKVILLSSGLSLQEEQKQLVKKGKTFRNHLTHWLPVEKSESYNMFHAHSSVKMTVNQWRSVFILWPNEIADSREWPCFCGSGREPKLTKSCTKYHFMSELRCLSPQ